MVRDIFKKSSQQRLPKYDKQHLPSEMRENLLLPYPSSSQENEQCVYASHAAMVCFFYCKALGIADRFGVWECILYLMNMFHNHGVNHLNIANVLSLSYCLQLKRVEKLLKHVTPQSTAPLLATKYTTAPSSYTPSSPENFILNPTHITSEQMASADVHAVSDDLHGVNRVPQTEGCFPKAFERREQSASIKGLHQPIHSDSTAHHRLAPDSSRIDSPRSRRLASNEASGPYYSDVNALYSNSSYAQASAKIQYQESLSRCHPSVPLHKLDDCRLTWVIFVSCWLAFIWIEDIKIPLIHWCDVLRIVPLNEHDQEHVNQGGFQQHFINEVVLFWKDLGCLLNVSKYELDEAYTQMLGLSVALPL